MLRLNLTYNRARKLLQRDLIGSCRFVVEEDVEYDNWNGGTHGHNVILFLPLDELAKIEIDSQAGIGEAICKDLNTLGQGVSNEFYNAVYLELEDEGDPRFQRAIPFATKPPVDPDALTIWKPGLCRVFISHRDKHKGLARELADALEEFGMSSFVAHETIPANEEWRKVIVNGLETMEIMVLFLTDDFSDSIWTMQEVGYALGKGVPIISLKVGHKDPPGFVSHVQALKGNSDEPLQCAQSLSTLIGKALQRPERVQEVLVASFIESPSFSDAKVRFDRMASTVTKLTDEQLTRIIAAFSENDQLHYAGHLTSKFERLRKFLERATGKRFVVGAKAITEVKTKGYDDLDDDIPF